MYALRYLTPNDALAFLGIVIGIPLLVILWEIVKYYWDNC